MRRREQRGGERAKREKCEGGEKWGREGEKEEEDEVKDEEEKTIGK